MRTVFALYDQDTNDLAVDDHWNTFEEAEKAIRQLPYCNSLDISVIEMDLADYLLAIDFDTFSIDRIDSMIAAGEITEEEIIDYYGDEFWRDGV